MKHKCVWCKEEYIKELVFIKKDAVICFGCAMGLASTAIQVVQSNTMELHEIEKKIEEDKAKEDNDNKCP